MFIVVFIGVWYGKEFVEVYVSMDVFVYFGEYEMFC